MVRFNADPAHRNRSLTTGPIFGVQLIDDLRLCCRTFTLNQIAHLLCSNINYNIERHTYDAVSCYNLRKAAQDDQTRSPTHAQRACRSLERDRCDLAQAAERSLLPVRGPASQVGLKYQTGATRNLSLFRPMTIINPSTDQWSIACLKLPQAKPTEVRIYDAPSHPPDDYRCLVQCLGPATGAGRYAPAPRA